MIPAFTQRTSWSIIPLNLVIERELCKRSLRIALTLQTSDQQSSVLRYWLAVDPESRPNQVSIRHNYLFIDPRAAHRFFFTRAQFAYCWQRPTRTRRQLYRFRSVVWLSRQPVGTEAHRWPQADLAEYFGGGYRFLGMSNNVWGRQNCPNKLISSRQWCSQTLNLFIVWGGQTKVSDALRETILHRASFGSARAADRPNTAPTLLPRRADSYSTSRQAGRPSMQTATCPEIADTPDSISFDTGWMKSTKYVANPSLLHLQ